MADPDQINLCVLGAGSVRCMPAVIGSLAGYFGERPLEIRFWDADDERLDLFDRFARLCFSVNKCPHRLLATSDPAEALEGAERVAIVVGQNCARKFLKGRVVESSDPVAAAVERLREYMEPVALVLSMVQAGQGPGWRRLHWPGTLTEVERRALPHQILRYLHGDEFLHDFLREYRKSPLKSWLDDPEAEL